MKYPRIWIAAHGGLKVVGTLEHIPLEVLYLMADEEDWGPRNDAAGHPDTPVELLRHLAKDVDQMVRWTVGANTNTPSDVLRLLSADASFDVRASVAENPNTPREVLIKLASRRDESESLVYEAAERALRDRDRAARM